MNWFREVRYAVRALGRDKAFTFTVLVTLAVCIGANAATFAIVNSVLLRPLPVPESDAILLMSNRYPKAGVPVFNWSSVPDYYDRRRDVDVFEEQAMFNFRGQTLELNGIPERITSMAATPSLFRLLRVAPALGRAFTNDEGEIGAEQKVILSHGLWQQLYAGDSDVLGRELRLSGRPFTVVGVMPRDFLFMDPDVRLWVPLAFTAEQKQQRHSNNWHHVGRLKAGATLAQAQAQVDAVNAANMDRFPQWKEILTNAGFHSVVERLQDTMVRDVKGILYLLWGGAAFVLLIGALNVANLALVRLTMRRKEFATRLALGAGSGQLTRQFVMENLLLTLAGGVAGVVLGDTLLGTLGAIGLEQLPRASEIRMDGFAVVTGLVMAAAVGVLIGLLPLAGSFRMNLSSALVEDSRSGTAGHGTRRVRQSLVVAQVGFAFVLLVGAGLLMASLRELLRVDPGFKSEGVITASTSLPGARYAGDNVQRTFMNRALEAIRTIPGVTSAGSTTSIPFGGSYSDAVILAEGYQMQPSESLVSPRQVTVTPGYFEAMRTTLVEGRPFDARDHETAPLAVIVDQRLAQKFWPGQSPLGRRMYMPQDINNLLKIDKNTRWLTVVGVVRDVRLEDLSGAGNTAGAYYFPYAQSPDSAFTIAAAVEGDLNAAARAIRAEIARLDPELALFQIRPMEEWTRLSLASRRTSLLLAGGYGALALFLSAVGIYGVLAYHVTQRRREFGIRLALGSTDGGIVKLVLRELLLLVGTGLALGMTGAVALQRLIENEIYGVRPLEPFVLAGVVALLGLIALAAAIFPARRATRVDPIVALRFE
ncbi:MAG: ABC transporter permease [Candidatus Acidiferrales bacterium]